MIWCPQCRFFGLEIHFCSWTMACHGIRLYLVSLLPILLFQSSRALSIEYISTLTLPTLTIYGSSNCSNDGVKDKLAFSLATFQRPQRDYKNASFKVTGLWKLQIWGCRKALVDVVVDGVVGTDGPCHPLSIPPFCPDEGYLEFLTERYGGRDQRERELKIFEEPHFSGNRTQIRDKESRLNATRTIRSFYFTGNYIWHVFEGADFTGKEVVLKPADLVRINGNGITFVKNTTIRVGSLRLGSKDSSKAHSLRSSAVAWGLLGVTVIMLLVSMLHHVCRKQMPLTTLRSLQ